MKTAIIVPAKNLLEITQVCLDSIAAYSQDVKIILVDDGSANEVANDFMSYCSGHNIEYIRNNESKGWCQAINLGYDIIKKESFDFVVMLNNDVVVTPFWLERMQTHFKIDAGLGLLGCTTNRVEGYQHINFNKDGVDFQYTDVITGFCMMIPGVLAQKLWGKDGFLLDPRFGLGGQDDADISFRIKDLGYKVGIARNVFIYHYGSATFRKEFGGDCKKSEEYARSRVDILRNKYVGAGGSVSYLPEPRHKPLIYIAVPTLGEIKPELVQRLVHWCRSDTFNVRFEPLIGQLPLDNARSQCVKRFLELAVDDKDRLWFIDDDIIPPFDALDRLYAHDKDVVGALCFMMKHDDAGRLVPVPVALRYNEQKKYVVCFDGQGLTEVDATGGGCLMIKRHVFEDIALPMYQFHYHPDGTLKLVGDFHFCRQVQAAGMKILIDFSCQCDHIKPVGLKMINDLLANK